MKILASLLALSLAGSNPIVLFVIIGVLVAVALYYLPRILPMDAQAWMIIRVIVLIALIVWGLRIFGVL